MAPKRDDFWSRKLGLVSYLTGVYCFEAAGLASSFFKLSKLAVIGKFLSSPKTADLFFGSCFFTSGAGLEPNPDFAVLYPKLLL